MADIPDDFTRHELISPYHDLVGPLYVKRGAGGVAIGMPVARKHINRRGFLHGGMVCSLVDFAMGKAARRTTDPPRNHVTINLSTEFVGNATEGDWVEARADVLRSGRRLVFTNCFVYRGTERIARGSGTFLVLGANE